VDIESRVIEILEVIFPDETIVAGEDVDFGRFESWDSIKYVTIVLAIEQEFKIKLNKDEILEFSSLDNVIRILRARGF